MQQFATSQTSIAANKLTFDDIKQSSATPHDASNSAFNTSIDSSRQDSDSQKSAFEDVLSKQEQSAQGKARHNSDLGESKSKEAVQQDVEQVNKSRSDEKSHESKESKLVDNKNASEQQVIPEKQRHSEVSNSDNIVEDFDWVTYVNKVKDLSAPAETIPNDLHIEGD